MKLVYEARPLFWASSKFPLLQNGMSFSTDNVTMIMLDIIVIILDYYYYYYYYYYHHHHYYII